MRSSRPDATSISKFGRGAGVDEIQISERAESMVDRDHYDVFEAHQWIAVVARRVARARGVAAAVERHQAGRLRPSAFTTGVHTLSASSPRPCRRRAGPT